MKNGTSSATAWGVAMARVAHVRFDDAPPIFDDSLAFELIDPALQGLIERFGPSDPALEPIRRARAYLPFRQRYQEERLTAAYERGVRQYVVLGAGLDSYAFRQPEERRDLAIFEIDFPATQEEKRARIEALGWLWPDNLHFAPCDFERETVSDALARQSFDPARPTFFAWMGVTVYLEHDTIREALEELRTLSAPGSALAFEYALPTEGLSGSDQISRAFSLAAETRRDEPFVSFFLEEQIADMTRKAGWPRFEALDHEAASRRILAGRTDQLSLHQGLRLAEASC